MTITFDINDVTSLSGEKEVSIRVSGINASGDEMPLASHLTSKVKELVVDYVTKKEDDTKKEE